eukprot:COSAG02_NODE_33599_length_497_cov_2.057789_1_plen_44_part_01
MVWCGAVYCVLWCGANMVYCVVWCGPQCGLLRGVVVWRHNALHS